MTTLSLKSLIGLLLCGMRRRASTDSRPRPPSKWIRSHLFARAELDSNCCTTLKFLCTSTSDQCVVAYNPAKVLRPTLGLCNKNISFSVDMIVGFVLFFLLPNLFCTLTLNIEHSLLILCNGLKHLWHHVFWIEGRSRLSHCCILVFHPLLSLFFVI